MAAYRFDLEIKDNEARIFIVDADNLDEALIAFAEEALGHYKFLDGEVLIRCLTRNSVIRSNVD